MGARTPERKARPPVGRQREALVKDMSRLVRQALADALTRLSLQGETDHAALVVERAANPVAPERLAAAHPGDAQAQAEARALYERCLAHYREVVRAHEAALPVDDVGAAVAAFVAANMQALHGVAASSDVLLQLERQLSGVALRSSAWDAASARERQNYFEQMAILAVLIGESSAQAPRQGAAAVANVQRAARTYLQQLLGLNPDQLKLGAGGLSLRGATHECGAQVVEPPPA
jgi:hypothetical protein